MKTQSMSISEFMSGSYKKEKKNFISLRAAATISVPFLLSPLRAFASGPEAITVGATQYIGEKTLETIAHALDPLVDLMVALSFPVCSVIIVGACFFFMLGKSDRAWSSIQNAGLGYVLIQIMPLLLNVLKEVGGAI
ncbi:hypothetical protein [Peribacillus loiseleuriae]|uniref:TrbC/VIRB2 family protein n=1 Tax=Peribacillus loiseleuriae TaxID=1679170 RepID=A0A0K9GRK1_9BACI|nr:hypothetical protein [Peribacillus loiseleuriae]KMY49263.1 hypothetical protein AC625_06780 [Peribacillus loiseleuriae]